MEGNVQVIEQVQQEIVSYVGGLPTVVKNREQCEAAKRAVMDIRKEIKRRYDILYEKMLEEPKKAWESAKKHLKEVKAVYDAQEIKVANILAPMETWRTETDDKILEFERKERAAAAQKQAEELRKYNARAAQAEAKGKDPEGVKPPKFIPEPPKTTKTAAGAYTVKVNKKLQVVDETKIPGYEAARGAGAYWTVTRNDKAIEAALRAGHEIPGCILADELASAGRVA